MITRIQNFFLKHNKWLFGSLLVVIIVTFVLTIGPQSIFDGPQGQQRQSMVYYGYDLASPGTQQQMVRHAELSMALNPELRMQRDQLMDYAYMRLAGLGMADRLGIPSPDRERLADYVATLSVFQDPTTGEFSSTTYNELVASLDENSRFSRETLAAVLREDYRISRVRDILSGADLSLPSEVKQDFIDMEATYSFTLAHFNRSNFQPEIDPSVEAVRQFFDENPSRYEIPEQIEVVVLMFNGEKWLDQIEEPAEEDLASYFTTNEARYQPAPDPEAETEPAAVTLDDVRDRVLADLRMERARRVAEERASAFTLTLWNQKVPYGSAEYIALLEEFRVDETPLPPYSREQPPRTEAPRDMLESMWVYVESSFRYFSDLARTSQGAAVGVLLDRMEQRMPPFEEVQDAVAEDYISAETRRLFAERGNEIRATLQENVDAFADTASELGLSIEEMEPFVGREVPFQIRFNGIWEQIQFLDEGEVSAMIINGNRGSFALLTNKEVPEVTTDSDAFATFAQQRRDAIRSSLGWTRLSEIKDRSLTSLFGTDTLPQ